MPIHKLLGKIYVIIVLCLHLARGDVKLGMLLVWFYLCALVALALTAKRASRRPPVNWWLSYIARLRVPLALRLRVITDQ